ncbi:similar to anti-silencing factor [Cyanidioschyzon merolae strain 10D]|jgi:histone chaperone ASF1|uniref:Similar to anti-silencing factor n=1 Tax=Cyanidioschyzon merolae (strain NIES-3377 / 10D) TaxID=280699 RepID=M1V4T3_CYAM1|nr:similar to anti-silencing factor [Cyanidioschyzon merolae strain 10D]BAM79650.1 similar to anti-silencing factor [Cyanidioschyzon merolae strain 10D]|eukprot:XP_005535936.1 similar to anti-silencing factor [Cyanidioschyzon merolae strain 10D]
MAAVDIISVAVENNPAPFLSNLRFAIAYEVREALSDDIEWRVVYVGSASSESYDQELDAVLVPADTPGRFAFVLEVPPPRPERIPEEDATGVTIVLVTCSYRGQEFIRVGYYLCNEYPPEVLKEAASSVKQRLVQAGMSEAEAEAQAAATVEISPPQWDKLLRNILAEQPRVTRFPCSFDRSVPAKTPSTSVAATDQIY